MKTIAYNIDCMEYMAALEGNAFDLAIVDPPYGIGINHNMGRRKGDKKSSYKKVNWDNTPPQEEYFIELFRVSKNQIIWGANYFISLMPKKDTKCWILWDKLFSPDVSFSQFEMAWGSFNSTCKKFTLPPNSKIRIHPTQKPVKLYRWLLQNYAKKGDKILDTHLGSGSSRIAADEMGFEFVGCELDSDYFDDQEARFKKYKSQTRLFETI